MSYSNKYIAGDRLVDCDICGFTYRYSQMRKQDGLTVCPKDFNKDQPRDTAPKPRTINPLPEVE